MPMHTCIHTPMHRVTAVHDITSDLTSLREQPARESSPPKSPFDRRCSIECSIASSIESMAQVASRPTVRALPRHCCSAEISAWPAARTHPAMQASGQACWHTGMRTLTHTQHAPVAARMSIHSFACLFLCAVHAAVYTRGRPHTHTRMHAPAPLSIRAGHDCL